jgi:hypothetical protein
MGTESYGLFIRRSPEEDLDWLLFTGPFTVPVWRFLSLYWLFVAISIVTLEILVGADGR